MILRLLSLYGELRHVPPLGGRRRFGVPPGGPFDVESATLAAALARCPAESVVELAFGAATFAVEAGGTLAIAGAGRAERRLYREGESLTLVPEGGARLALAAPGGWTPPALGADPESSLAVTVGTTLTAIEHASAHAPLRDRRLYREPPSAETTLRVVAGPQRSLWRDVGVRFTVSPLLDRRGVRLRGAPEHGHEIASEPCVPGVVQWTPGGELIILGPEGPTIGGYPKPFVVIAADLSRVGQLRPGANVRLVEVEPDEARRLDRESRAALAGRLLRLRLANAVDGSPPGG